MRARSYSGSLVPRMFTVPSSPGAAGPKRSSAPHTRRARSWMTRMTPKVATSWKSSGAWYTRRRMSSSTTTPMIPTATPAKSTATQKPNAPERCSTRVYAMYAPSM